MTNAPIEIAKLCDGGRTISYGIVQPGKPTPGGVPIVRVNNFRGNSLSLEDALLVDPDIERKFVRSRPKRDDVLITLVGSMGQVAISPPELEGWNLARAVGLIPTNDRHKAHWIFYALQMPAAQRYIQSRANTTVQATFNLGDLASLKIPFPERSEREAIIRVLSALDDKIELNRRMNETLEQMAQAIFKDWFVDFGPVRRKQEGASDPIAIMGGLVQNTARAAELAALFPDALVEDSPIGWRRARLGDNIDVKRGGSPRPIQDFIAPKGLPWLKIADATSNDSPYLFETKEFIREEGLKKTVQLKAGSLILSNSATPGLPKFVMLDACIHDGWLYFPRKQIFSDQYLYLYFLHLRESLVSQGNGSIFTNLKTDIVKSQPMLIPDERVLAAFQMLVAPMFDLLLLVAREIRTLAETRDYLLPKLMSGEVRVREALEMCS